MNMEQAYRILTSVGLSVQYEKNFLKEKLLPAKNYYQLIKKHDCWEYSGVDYETTPGPRIVDRKEFATEGEGTKYFVLKRLQSFYFYKYRTVSPIIHEITSFADFEEKMKKLGIKEDHYSFSSMKPQSFLANKVEENQIMIRYINKHKNVSFSSLPLDFDKGSHVLFNYVYLLHLLKNLESNLMNEQVLDKPFTDQYIETFIS